MAVKKAKENPEGNTGWVAGGIVTAFNKTLEDVCKQYDKDSMELGKTERTFKVQTQMAILRKVCEILNLTFSISPRFIDVSPASRTIGSTVRILTLEGNILIAETFGISTRYTYSFESKVKDATTEVTSTVALGKALSLLGIVPMGTSNTSSREELQLFQAAQNVNISEIRAKAAHALASLDENLKKRAKMSGVTLETVMELMDVNTDTPEKLAERLQKYLENPQGTKSTDVSLEAANG